MAISCIALHHLRHVRQCVLLRFALLDCTVPHDVDAHRASRCTPSHHSGLCNPFITAIWGSWL